MPVRRHSSQNWRAGKYDFLATDVDSLRQKIKVILLSEGHDGRRQVGDRGIVEFRLVRALKQAAGDPDVEIFGTYPSGVRIGVGQKMPRTPAVFERKTAWSLESQADPDVHLWSPATVRAVNANYKSARELSEAVERELQASVERAHTHDVRGCGPNVSEKHRCRRWRASQG